MKRSILASCLLACTPLFAVQIDPIAVTANPLASPQEPSLLLTEVVQREDILNSGAQSIADALTLISSVHIAQTGGEGSQMSIFTRGTESDHTLIMVDGIELNSVNGTAYLNTISVESIERIEVIKGASNRYGANAIGGIINIITTREDRDNSVTVKAGTDNSVAGALSLTHQGERTQLTVNLGVEYSQGIDSAVDREPDEDSYRNAYNQWQIRHDFTDHFYVSGQFQQAFTALQYDGYSFAPNNETRVDQSLGNARMGIDYDRFQSQITLTNQIYLSDDFVGETRANFSHFRSREFALNWDNQINLFSFNSLNFGAFYQDESSNQIAYEGLYQGGLYVQPQFRFGMVTVETQYRYNEHSDFKTLHTWGSNVRLQYADSGFIQLGANQGYKYPTSLDNYFGTSPGLKPEEAQSYEITLSQSIDNFTAVLSGFQNEIDNLIAYDPATSSSKNIAEVNTRGIETGLSYRAKRWSQSVNWTWLEAQDISDDDLLRRPKNSLSLVGGYQLLDSTHLHWSATAQSSFKDYDFSFAQTKVGGFGLINLGLTQDLTDDVSLSVDVKNLLDKEYQTVFGYNQPGREAFLNLTASF
ncbi:MAG: TonB-dependent receptor [Pseudomonadota bacterium]|nr:TonB-dependent receptor [Pseudomonadota bacterium]